jgi:hypothetical protein
MSELKAAHPVNIPYMLVIPANGISEGMVVRLGSPVKY